MEPSSFVRAGLIGCGNVVFNDHAPTLRQLASVEPVAAADPSAANRQRVLDLLGLPGDRGFASYKEMLRAHRLEYVVVAVPPAMRQAIINDCAASGVHVLSEKPIATRPREAAEMQVTMSAAGLKLGMVHNYLFYPEYRLIRRLAAQGEVGELRHITLNFMGVPDNPGSRGYRPNWRHDPAEAGGGVLMDMLHAFYVAEYLMSGEIRAVNAVVDNLGQPGDPVEDIALVHLYFDSGYATINMGWASGPGGVEVSGSSGRIMAFYDDYGTGPFSELESFTLVNQDGRRAYYPRQDSPTSENFLAIHQDFVEAINGDRNPVAPASVGQRSLEAALAAYLSALQGCVVELPFDSGHPVFAGGVAGFHDIEHWKGSPLRRRGLFGLRHRSIDQ